MLQTYIFPAEVATPLQSLYDMEASGVAGVTSDYKEHQTKIFIDLLREILEWSKWRNNFLLIKYKWSLGKYITVIPKENRAKHCDVVKLICEWRCITVLTLYRERKRWKDPTC